MREAQQMAEEKGLDLVEVAPNAVPPVCRLMDYGKYRYEQSKKDREARKNQRQAEVKEVRLRPKTDDHDLEVKSKMARRFLLAGDKVKFTMRFRGREMAHPDIGRQMLEQLAESLQDLAVIEQKPVMEGRACSLVLSPNPKVLKALVQAQRNRARAAQETRTKAQQSAPVPDVLVDVDDTEDVDGDDAEEVDGAQSGTLDVDDIEDSDLDLDDDFDEEDDED